MMKDFSSEITFKTQRSSGPGGQNVNKVETSVTAMWNVVDSIYFSEEEKQRILIKLKNRINSDSILQVTSQESRSQWENKFSAKQKLLDLVKLSLVVPKVRRDTKPTYSSKLKRLDQKKQHSQKKKDRGFRL